MERDIIEIAEEYEQMSEWDLHNRFYTALPIGSPRYNQLHFEIRQLAITAKENRKAQL